MKPITTMQTVKALSASLSICALAGGLFLARPAAAQDGDPPPEIIATVDPVYFEGHAAYWFNNHWYYRDGGGRWNHYDREPPALADRRLHNPPARHDFGRGGGGRPPAPHPSGSHGGGGHGGGGHR